MLKDLKIRWKLTILMSILALIPLIGVSYYAQNNLQKSIETNIKNNFSVTAANILKNIDLVLETAVNDAKLQIKNELMQDIISEDVDGRIEKWITTVANNNNFFKYIIVTDADGKIVASNNTKLKGSKLELQIKNLDFVKTDFFKMNN